MLELEYIVRVPTEHFGLVELGFPKGCQILVVRRAEGAYDDALYRLVGAMPPRQAPLTGENVTELRGPGQTVAARGVQRSIGEVAEELYAASVESGGQLLRLRGNFHGFFKVLKAASVVVSSAILFSSPPPQAFLGASAYLWAMFFGGRFLNALDPEGALKEYARAIYKSTQQGYLARHPGRRG